MTERIAPRSGVAFLLPSGARLKVIDPQGEQVSDLVAFNADDVEEFLSNGRTLDYLSKIYLSRGDPFIPIAGRIMFEIIEDTVGRHDFLLTPCSADTFRIIYGHEHPHRGCFGNLVEALAPYGIGPDRIPTAFNVFHERAHRRGNRGAYRRATAEPGGRPSDYRSEDGPDYRADGLFGGTVEQLCVQAD